MIANVPPPVKAEIQTKEFAIRTMADALESWTIETPEDEIEAGELLVSVVADRKRIDGQRTSITKPINEAKRAVDVLFAPVLDTLKRCEALLRSKVAEAATRRELANAQALDAARLASETGNGSIGEALAQIVDRPELAGVSFREDWTFDVIEFDSIPRRFMTIDEDEILSEIKAGAREIPGLRIYSTRTPIVRTKGG